MFEDDVTVPAGWYPDPMGLPQLRWWNNHAWTELTTEARPPLVMQTASRLAYADEELPTRRQQREQRERDEQYANLATDEDDARDAAAAYAPLTTTLREIDSAVSTEVSTPDENLDDNHLMRMAGRFSRRLRAWAKANNVPVVYCSPGERKHKTAEQHLSTHQGKPGLFLVLVSKAPALVWEAQKTGTGKLGQLMGRGRMISMGMGDQNPAQSPRADALQGIDVFGNSGTGIDHRQFAFPHQIGIGTGAGHASAIGRGHAPHPRRDLDCFAVSNLGHDWPPGLRV